MDIQERSAQFVAWLVKERKLAEANAGAVHQAVTQELLRVQLKERAAMKFFILHPVAYFALGAIATLLAEIAYVILR